MKPRLLLVEDDPISHAFMLAALEALPARVDSATSISQALRAEESHDLWLIDANLPDGSGARLLAGLRRLHPRTPALAHTADPSADMRRSLLEAGFAAVLVKPLSAADLQSAVHAHLPAHAARIGDWDETAALKALNGSREHVDMLRRLFLDELPGSVDAVEQSFRAGDQEALRAVLHKLRASCGFVGASRLGAAARQLQQAPASLEALMNFRAAADVLVG
ncbi:response regulator [Pseudoxanthomonas beigongshangi]